MLHLNFDKSTIQGDAVKDKSGEGNDGTINGGAKSAAGKYGEALEFDGANDFVEIPLEDSITFSTGDSLTVQVWVKTDDEPPNNDGIVGNYLKALMHCRCSLSAGTTQQRVARWLLAFAIRDVRIVLGSRLQTF